MAALSALSFGPLLRHHRLAAGLTQEDLAERAGVSPRAVSALELGERRKPYRQTIGLLAAALQLSPVEAEMLGQAAGYTSTKPARTAPAPVPAVPPLVGRSRELAAVEAYLDRPQPPVLALTGEPGIGKSRLLQEAARQAGAQGYTVLPGGAHRRSGHEPYAPLLTTLSRSLQELSSSQMRTALMGCGWLPRLLPELVEIVSVPLPTGTLPPEQERRLVFAAVARYLANIAGPAGTILVLDDLQWSSPDGLDLLASVLRPEMGRVVRVLGAFRDTEVGPDHPLSALLADLAEHQLAERLKLEPLEDEDALSLLDSVLEIAEEDDGAIKKRIVQRAGGVPFFLISCALGVRDEDRDEGVPWTVAQSVRQRVAILPDSAQQVLSAAAILGRRIQRSALLEILGSEEDQALAGLDAACRARLLAPEGRAAYRFAHDVVRESIEAQLSSGQRVVLHRKAGEALERHLQRQKQLEGRWQASELAWHFIEANQPERAVVYAIEAGDQACLLFAHDDARQHYDMALQLARETSDRRREAEAREKLGNLLWSTGSPDAALPMLEQAADLYESLSVLDALGRVVGRIGWAHANRGTPDEGIARLEPLAARCERSGSISGLVDVYDGLAHLYRRTGMYDQAVTAAERAAEIARADGDDRLVVRGDLNRAFSLFWQHRTGEALQLLAEIVPWAEMLQEIPVLYRASYWLAVMSIQTGEFTEAMSHVQRGIELAGWLEMPSYLMAALGVRAELLYLLGEWDEAQVCLEQALASAWPAPAWVADIHLGLAELAIARGHSDEAAAHAEAGAESAERTGNRGALPIIQRLLATQDLLKGQPVLARNCLQWVQEDFRLRSDALQVLAEALIQEGSLSGAAEIVSAGIEEARSAGLRLELVGWLLLSGMLYAQWMRWDDAREAFHEGLSLARQMPYPYGTARLLHELGRMNAAEGDSVQARRRFGEALSIFRGLDARPWIERTQDATRSVILHP